MSLPPDPAPPEAGSLPSQPLAWERWPLREDPRRWWKLLLVGLMVLAVGAVLVVSLPPTAAIALGLALVATLLPYLLPRHFEVGESGLEFRQGFYVYRRDWNEIKDCRKLAGAYLLSFRPSKRGGLPRPNLFSPGSKELVLAFPLEPEKLELLGSRLSRHIPIR